MDQPTLDDLLNQIENKYALVVIAAKRARILTDSKAIEGYPKGTKSVTVALNEIVRGRYIYNRPRGSFK